MKFHESLVTSWSDSSPYLYPGDCETFAWSPAGEWEWRHGSYPRLCSRVDGAWDGL